MDVLTNVTTISPQTYQGVRHTQTSDRDLNRLLTAAVVNKNFRTMLLADPRGALTAGYNGEAFFLKADEQDLILSIQATSLTEFANHITNHQHGSRTQKNT